MQQEPIYCLSSPLFNTGLAIQVVDMIAASKLQILNNTCGAINFLSNQPFQVLPSILPIILLKSLGAIISGNTCPFIYCGFANGDVVDGYGNRPYTNNNGIGSGAGLFSGYLNISNNVCSFIQIGRKVSLMALPLVLWLHLF